MLISIDYDDTFTADPDFWREFIERAKAHGHAVVCVTARWDGPGNRAELAAAMPGIPVVFSDQRCKRDASEEAGHLVDVWIDDLPEAIVGDLGQLETLRQENANLRTRNEVLREEVLDAQDAAVKDVQKRLGVLRGLITKKNAEIRRLKELLGEAAEPPDAKVA